jgi:hypothetical protein
MAIYFFGGWNSPKIVVGPTQGPGLYLLGLLIVALYAPLYWWRAWQDRKLTAAGRLPGQLAPAAAGAGGPALDAGTAPFLTGDDAAGDGQLIDPVTTAEPPGEPSALS